MASGIISLALEWTRDNIALLGGNPSQVTISGYPAGAYSVFYQLAYDLRLSPEQSLLKQACIWSNSPAIQPRNEAAAQVRFNQLLSALKIPMSLSWTEKLSRLRSIPAKPLLDAATSIELHQFHPTSDGSFIDPSLFKSFDNGAFAARSQPETSESCSANNGEALQVQEKPMVREAFIDPLTRFVRGDADADISWGTGDYRQVRTLRPDRSVQICEDGLWDEATRVWRALPPLREVGEPGEGATSAKL